MKRILIIIFLLAGIISAQQMNNYASRSLFSDYKANRIGDAITVIVIESSQASNRAETNTDRESDINLGGSGTFGEQALPKADFSLNTQNTFDGSGATTTSGMVETKISALIDTIFANGNLKIVGRRMISINGEEQVIKISGIVRPSDIQADNSVVSYNISESEIVLEGHGMRAKSQEPSWLTQQFH